MEATQNTARLQDPKTAEPDNPVPPPCQDFLTELQDAFAVFLSDLLQDKTLTAAVDGKTNKQMLDNDGKGLQMLNVFVHDMKITLQVLQEHHLDYVFQIENQPAILEAVKLTFDNIDQQVPAAKSVSKKRQRRNTQTLDGFSKCVMDSERSECSEWLLRILCGADSTAE